MRTQAAWWPALPRSCEKDVPLTLMHTEDLCPEAMSPQGVGVRREAV